jgi:hypothetical protein
MQILDIKLLSAALRVKWDHHAHDRGALRLLRERVPGHDDGEYAEAFRLATAMDDEAYRLAAAWFASGGRPEMWPKVVDLGGRCPGFALSDYDEAIEKNILWARK